MEPIIIAFGAIIAAFVSGIFVVMNFFLTKDQKTSEFRQNWIDLLRNDVAAYISINEVMFSNLIYKTRIFKISNDELQKFFENNLSNFIKRNNARNTIYLRINPKDDREIIEAMQSIETYWEGKKDFELNIITKDIDKLIQLIQVLLKKEWNRVKRGELSYIIIKYSFIALVIGLFIIAILLFNGKITLPNMLVFQHVCK